MALIVDNDDFDDMDETTDNVAQTLNSLGVPANDNTYATIDVADKMVAALNAKSVNLYQDRGASFPDAIGCQIAALIISTIKLTTFRRHALKDGIDELKSAGYTTVSNGSQFLVRDGNTNKYLIGKHWRSQPTWDAGASSEDSAWLDVIRYKKMSVTMFIPEGFDYPSGNTDV